MIKAKYRRYLLKFKEPATTSRQTMTEKETFFITLYEEESPSLFGVGEAAIFRGLSADDKPDYETELAKVCDLICNGSISVRNETDGSYSLGDYLHPYSSIQFGLESAVADLNIRAGHCPKSMLGWESGKTSIIINGLVWMGNSIQMLHRIDDKLNSGFNCIKLKIGGIDFEEELNLLAHIRERYDRTSLTVRLDANGAFSAGNALKRLERLAYYDIHSIEQPVKAGQWNLMATICKESPIPIALDEELIGSRDYDSKRRLLDVIKPQMIILKPSLCGGLSEARRWCKEADNRAIGWWYTSALESNIGLNAIAREVAAHIYGGNACASWPQGLGTGGLYTNNIPFPLTLRADRLSRIPQI
ncbi:MAG: o-succinylbenzoate synthase [Muribaculum sp.]|nr:o-succinylbenzoate synthase [Muribaculum sp.]